MFPQEYIDNLANILIRRDVGQQQNESPSSLNASGASASSAPRTAIVFGDANDLEMMAATEGDKDIDGVPMEDEDISRAPMENEDIDGVPMEDENLDGVPMENEDIDGVPMEDDDLDGVPL